MKKILAVLILAATTIAATAQDGVKMPSLGETQVGRIIALLENAPELAPETNTTVVIYASHAKGLVDASGHQSEWGGGFAILHPFNDYASAGFRMQWLAGDVYVPSVTAQFKTTKRLFPKTYLTTGGFTGAILPVGGLADNSEPSLTYGVFASIKFQVKDNLDLGIAYGLEYWPGLNQNRIEHFGPVLNYRF